MARRCYATVPLRVHARYENLTLAEALARFCGAEFESQLRAQHRGAKIFAMNQVARALHEPGCKSISSDSRQSRITNHAIDVDVSWWNDAIDHYGVSGGPITVVRDGQQAQNGVGKLTRGDVFKLADAATASRDGALSLMWHSLAWGAGPKRRLCKKRIESIGTDEHRFADALISCAESSRTDALSAYRQICPAPGRNLVKFLGPAFATKYLYFSGGGRIAHPCLILDSRVATTLKSRAGWSDLRTDGLWPVETYAEYCELLGSWSVRKSAELGRPVGADEYERCLFDSEVAGS